MEQNDDIINQFRESFEELIAETKLSMGDFAKDIHMSRFVVHKLLTSETNVRFMTLIRIADYFDCPIEYLCGRAPRQCTFEKQTRPPFAEWFPYILDATGHTWYEVYKATGIASTRKYEWENNGTHPRLISLDKIARYLSISTDLLVGRCKLNK